jgi:hypothetical protein
VATPYGDFERIREMLEAWTKQIAPMARQMEAPANPPALREMADYLNSVQKQWNWAEKLMSKIDWDKVQDWWKRGLPPNLIDVEPRLDVPDVLVFMRATRWCLVWVPRGEVVRRLVDAEEESRGDVLLSSSGQIVEDSRSVLDAIEHPELQQVCRAAKEVADCIDAGFDMAAQSLAASVLSDVINTKFGLSFRQAQERFNVEDPMKIPWVRFREAAVLLLVAEALETYFHDKGDPVPARFSRHASAHSVSETQYNRENALAGLLLVSAFLMESELLAMEQDERNAAAEG